MSKKRTLTLTYPQIKICGLTQPHEAARCADLGADAIGVVFFPKSPRHVSDDQARKVVAAVPPTVAVVGVFVDADFSTIMARVEKSGIGMAQLHGRESPDLAAQLRAHGVGVIKALFVDGHPVLADAPAFDVDGYLVECAQGPLPGGNALTWDWRAARGFGRRHPLVLAGGLTPENVNAAIAEALPAAIDLSSGVEIAPGRKDPQKVARLIAAVKGSQSRYGGRTIPSVFHPKGS